MMLPCFEVHVLAEHRIADEVEMGELRAGEDER